MTSECTTVPLGINLAGTVRSFRSRKVVSDATLFVGEIRRIGTEHTFIKRIYTCINYVQLYVYKIIYIYILYESTYIYTCINDAYVYTCMNDTNVYTCIIG